jgi:hypothetical protein
VEISEVTVFVDFFEVLHVQLFCKVLQLPMCSNTEDELIQQLRYGAFHKLRLHLGWVGGQKNV